MGAAVSWTCLLYVIGFPIAAGLITWRRSPQDRQELFARQTRFGNDGGKDPLAA